MIIGICGLIGSGKGTVADILVENHNFEKLSFADKLKDGVASVFGWDRDMLEGDTDPVEYGEKRCVLVNETGKYFCPVSSYLARLYATDFDGIWVSLVKQKILENR